MTAEALQRVLAATGYIADGAPANGVLLDNDARSSRRGRAFAPDALWSGQSSLKVYFKSVEAPPPDEEIAAWRQEVWNEGFAPLLWVVSPDRIDLYNGFGRPFPAADAARNRLATFEAIDASLAELDALAGRLAMETGQFWLNAPSVDRKTAVDQQLLSDLASLERDLVAADLARPEAQALIGRSIFTQYLVDRDIVSAARLEALCGHAKLQAALRDRKATTQLFGWLTRTFNGDMFPPSAAAPPHPAHLERVADFLEAVNPATGQMTFFPYQFDVIPVELISSIYEQFAHSGAAPVGGRPRSTEASRAGVYYTRLPVVSLILDEVMDGLSGRESPLRNAGRVGRVSKRALSSAFASWFFIMTAAEYGLWKQRLFRRDVALLPTPDLASAASSKAGAAIRALEQRFQQRPPTPDDWAALDLAVFDLYGLGSVIA